MAPVVAECTIPAGASGAPPARYVVVRPFMVNVISPRRMMCAVTVRAYALDKARRGHLARHRFAETFSLQFFGRLFLVHGHNSTSARFLVSRLPFSSKNGSALLAAMGVAAKRACRLQERRSCLQNSREQSIVPRRRRLVVAHSWHPLATLRY